MQKCLRAIVGFLAVVFALLCRAPAGRAQDLQPRRWSHLPVNVNFAASGVSFTQADISFDPALRLENVEMERHSTAVKYIRTFNLLGKSARVDWLTAYQDAEWTGLVDGVPASTARQGWSDMSVRFAVNLFGAPALSAEEFAEYRSGVEEETIVGVALITQLPTGHYLEDRLLNLGTNRYTFRPQLGVVRNVEKWSAEVTAGGWLYTANEQFFGRNELKQDPFVSIQSHLVYTLRPGVWVAGGVGYGCGNESTINGISQNDRRENIGWLLSAGYPITPQIGVKATYIAIRPQVPLGASSDSVVAAITAMW